MLSDLKIRNDKQYDIIIAQNDALKRAESFMNPASVNVVKKLIYNQNLFREFVPFSKLLNDVTYSVRERKVFAKAFHALFYTIAGDSNYASSNEIVAAMFEVLNLSDPKVTTLVLIGASNAGKTFLSSILRAGLPMYDVGIVQSVHQRPGDFWLQDCIGKEMYCCEELNIASRDVLQRFKALMEGNEALDTNVKYGGNKQIQRRPFIVTMNGTSELDVAGDFPEEYDAIKNRCKIFRMMTPLKDVIPSEIINFICKRKEKACKWLIDYFNDHYDQLNKTTDDDVIDKYIS